MESLQQQLSRIMAEVFTSLDLASESAVVVVSSRPDIGHFQCNGALREAKKRGLIPTELAQKVLHALLENAEAKNIVDTVTVEAPGFINLRIKARIVAQRVGAMSIDNRFEIPSAVPAKRITIDYGGLNIAKPMHVGHLRSLMIGESMKRILRFLGHDVTADVHLGDWGTQMGMIIMEIKQEQPDLPYFDVDIVGDFPEISPVTLKDLDRIYPQASARCKEDEIAMAEALEATKELQVGRPGYRALWQHIVNVSLSQLKVDVAGLNVSFDLWNGESHYHDWCNQMIARLRESGEAYESNGALIVELPEEQSESGKKLRELPPLLLTKSDGAFLYGTTDLAAVDQRVQELQQDVLLYIVDGRQSLHFEQVFRAARKTGIAPASVELFHADFGTVNGPDGKPFKTRSGETMKLDALVDMAVEAAQRQMESVNVGGNYSEEERERISRQVGLAALKFADLMNHRNSSYIFDVEKFTRFEGKTGPYLLYATVRMQSLLQKAAAENIVPSAVVINADTYESAEGQRAILGAQLHMLRLPEVLSIVARDYTPHVLVEFAYELSQWFHSLYDACPIFTEQDAERTMELLALVSAMNAQLRCILDLLAIEVPEKM